MYEIGTVVRFIGVVAPGTWTTDLTKYGEYEVRAFINDVPCIVDDCEEAVLIFADREEDFEIIE